MGVPWHFLARSADRCDALFGKKFSEPMKLTKRRPCDLFLDGENVILFKGEVVASNYVEDKVRSVRII